MTDDALSAGAVTRTHAPESGTADPAPVTITSSALPSDRPTWHNTRTGQATPTHSPIGRRETIRDSLEHGDWQAAAHHLHQAHSAQEWLGCGLSSWSAYVQTIPLSRMHDWRLRLTARNGTNQAGYSYRAAFELAKQSR